MDAGGCRPGITLPVFCLRALELGSRLTKLSHLIFAERFEVLRDANIVFELANRSAPQRKAMYRQAEHIREAIFEMHPLQQFCVSGALHSLDSHAARHGNG